MESVKSNISKRFNCVYMYSREIHNINDIFEQFIITFNVYPIIRKCNKTNIMEFHYKLNKERLIFCCDPNDINVITYKEVKDLCTKNNIEWRNQTYTGFITQLKDKYFDELNGRIKFTPDQRVELSNKFDNKCCICKCCIKDKKFDIDHITPLSNGGSNELNNLQVLCKPCHMVKCSSEHENGQYIKINDTESTYNKQVQDIMDSPLCQTHAFVEKVYFKKLEEDNKIFTIDINNVVRTSYIMEIIIIVFLLYLIK